MRRGGELSPADLGSEALHRDAILPSGSGQLCDCVGEGIADAAREALHCNDTAQADQHDEQTVLHQILAFFVSPKLQKQTFHFYSPFRLIQMLFSADYKIQKLLTVE